MKTLLLLADGPISADDADRAGQLLKDRLGLDVVVVSGMRQAMVVEVPQRPRSFRPDTR